MARSQQGSRGASELNQSRFAGLIFRAYRWNRARGICLHLLNRLEGGQFYSATLRRIVESYHGVQVGAYSYGECLAPGAWPAGVVVGRYVSIAPRVRIYLRNHPLDRLSMHPFFYNRDLGWVAQDTISTGKLYIGHDAWLGEGVIVTPGCSRIGIGAVVGAGAVLTKDVPDFGVAVGNPARIKRFRFPDETCRMILESRWWERSVEELMTVPPDMIRSLGEDAGRHPLLSRMEALDAVRR